MCEQVQTSSPGQTEKHIVGIVAGGGTSSTVTSFTQRNVTSRREGCWGGRVQRVRTRQGGRDALLWPSSSKSSRMLKTSTVLTFHPGKQLRRPLAAERRQKRPNWWEAGRKSASFSLPARASAFSLQASSTSFSLTALASGFQP